MNIKRVYEKDFKLIENFLNQNFSSPTHWPDWNIIISKYYNTNFFYFAAYEGNELIGICPAHKVKKGNLYTIYSGQFHFIPNGGWVFKKDYKVDNFSLSLKCNESFRSSGLPIMNEFNNTPNTNSINSALTLVIDLDQDIEVLWTNEIHSKRRNMIRKAEKMGVKVSKLQKNEFDEFYKIYTLANNRYGLNVMPKEMFEVLFFKTKNIKFDILVAKYDGEIHNIVVIAYDKNYATYWLGFSNDGIQNNGQGDFLQWEAIKLAKQIGCKYYDLCYIEKEKLPHIYKFKKGFAKNEIEIPVINQKPLTYKVINKFTKWY